jgi:DNA-binding transcriptional regulator LsrR (DeoR family)
MTKKEFNDDYWLARRDHALWLYEHEGMTYTQVGKHMGISQVSASRLCWFARFRRGDHRHG